MAARGPLPFVEVVSVERPSKAFPDPRGLDYPKEAFWHDLPLKGSLYRPYIYRWLRLSRLGRRLHVEVPAHQILVSAPEARAEAEADPHSSSDDATHARLYYGGGFLGAMLAVKALFIEVSRDARHARNRIGPRLRPRTSFSVWKLRRDAQTLSDLNTLQYQQDRLWNEIEQNETGDYLAGEIRGLRRFGYRKGEGRSTFVEDWKADIEHLHTRNDARLRRLSTAFETRVRLHNVASATALQAAVLVLTIVLLVLTVLMVPDSTWSRLGDILRQVLPTV